MTFSDIRPFAALSLYGLSVLSVGLVVAGRSTGSDTYVAEMEACIRSQFLENGFRVLTAEADRRGATISGQRTDVPRVTVFLNQNDPAEIRLGDLGGRFTIVRPETRLEPVQRLTDGIAAQCFPSSTARRVDRSKLRNAQPS
jgi:hypothetical protein